MPWQKNYNKTEVLNNAVKAFWLHGYESTSMNDLVEATGINRGSIYSAFPNKHALFMSALHHYDQILRGRFVRSLHIRIKAIQQQTSSRNKLISKLHRYIKK